MSQHKTGYVISYHGILCHDMLYVTTIAASLLCTWNSLMQKSGFPKYIIMWGFHKSDQIYTDTMHTHHLLILESFFVLPILKIIFIS